MHETKIKATLAGETADQIMALLKRKEMPFEVGMVALLDVLLVSYAYKIVGGDRHKAALQLSQLFADKAAELLAKTVN
jgi:hypothetical protein